MNELAFNLVIGLITSIWIGFLTIGLVKFWSRSKQFILLHRWSINCWMEYVFAMSLLVAVSLSIILFSNILYQEGHLVTVFIFIAIAIGIIYSPRFILDVSRGLKYNAKTGELARIKELEDQLKNR